MKANAKEGSSVCRLFVGGLFPEISEKDLRDRFKGFGKLEDLDIIKKLDDKGAVMKTFAYVNLVATQNDVNKCLTVFGKTKWKGRDLKVQMAKRSPLEKYQMERNGVDENSISDEAEPLLEDNCNSRFKSYDELLQRQQGKKCTPGTLVEGEKNWVVVKYGRVLPITYLRRRDMRKIAKFDPSKYSHCIRRLKDDDSSAEIELQKLKWEMPVSRKSLPKRNVPATLPKPSTAMPKKQPCNPIEVELTETIVERGKVLEDMSRFYSSSDSDHEEVLPEKSTKSNRDRRSSEDKTVPQDSSSNSSASDSDQSDIEENGEESPSSIVVKKNVNEDSVREDSNVNMDSSQSSSSSNSDDDIDSNCSLAVTTEATNSATMSSGSIIEEIRNLKRSNMNQMTSQRIEIPDPCQDAKDNSSVFDFDMEIDSSRSNSFLSSLNVSLHEESETNESSSSASNSDNELPNPYLDSVQKQMLSDAKRKQSLESRLLTKEKHKETIKEALGNIDTRVHGDNHLVFSDDDAGDSLDGRHQPLQSSEHVVSGKAAADWLGLGSGGSDTEDNEDDGIPTKPQFEGVQGEKLFKMQRRVGFDKRFALDKRFLDESDAENSNSETSDVPDDDTHADSDEATQQLLSEKQMTLSVIQGILGNQAKVSSVAASRDDSELFKRYDPDAEDHEDYELKPKKAKKTESTPIEDAAPAVSMETVPLPAVDSTKYYNVDVDLKSLFTPAEQGTFSFLGEAPIETIDDAEEKILPEPQITKPRIVDSSSEDEDSNMEEIIAPKESSAFSNKESFFFFENDKRLLESSEDGPHTFMRTGTIDEIIEEWNNTKHHLTLDYKRKHKDALRRKRKQVARKPN